jgi:hypothetical protein
MEGALSEAIRGKNTFEDIEGMFEDAPDNMLTKSLKDKILAKNAKKILTGAVRKLALAFPGSGSGSGRVKALFGHEWKMT